ncbi:MAG: D-alanine--D-alanine ligase [Candidatus Buchananbacteria bacterium]
MAKKIKVAVLCGGRSNEREISLKSGQQVLAALPKDKYEVAMIEIAKNGAWLLKNKQAKLSSNNGSALTIFDKQQGVVKSDLKNITVVFIALHGRFGEDGKIQALLEMLNIPYTGSGVLASALGMNKLKALELVHSYKIQAPRFLALSIKPKDIKEIAKEIKVTFGFPCVVKPNESGSSIGISIVKNISGLAGAIKEAFKHDSTVLIEQYIKGRELSCAVIGNTGQTDILALPIVEIKTKNNFFDYQAKYFSKATQEICPARIGRKISKRVGDTAKKVHEILGCDGLTRSDFILTAKNELYFLEINTIPGLTEASLSPKEAQVAGLSFGEFLEMQIKLALLKRK